MTGLLLTLLLGGSIPTQTNNAPEIRQVGLLRVHSYVRPRGSLFSPPDAAAREKAEALQRFLFARLAVEPSLEVAPPDELGRRIKAIRVHRDGAHLGMERMSIGRSKFKSLQMEGACEDLDAAHRTFESAYYEVVDPVLMADLSLIMAQCYAEKTLDNAHVALKEMFLRDPWRAFKKGFYSPEFEGHMSRALHDFNETYPKENQLGNSKRLDAFIEETKLDAVVSAWIEMQGSTLVARIEITDRHSRGASYRHEFKSTSRTEDRERIDRFISRWVTCLPTPQAPTNVAPPPPDNRFFIDTGFAYSIYGKDTTRRIFHNFGMGLSAEYQFLRGLGAFIQVNMFSSTRDPDRDLLDSFTAIRTIAGVSYAFRGNWWRLYVRAGFDVQFLGSYATTTDPWCKFAGRGDARCTGGVTDLGNDVTMGFHGAFGVQFFINQNVYLSVRVSASSYIVPLDATIEVNFPVTSELSLGYSF
ncbi:MAG: hypothetical protein ACI9OJ_001150 [Myxococcota bacterium]